MPHYYGTMELSPKSSPPLKTHVAKDVIANLQKTWDMATKFARTSKKFVYALLALHNGYPDLMSKELRI